MAPERDSAMGFSAVFFPPTSYDEAASQNLLVKIYSFKETDLKGDFVLRDSHLADARIGKGEKREKKRSNPNYPPLGAAVGYSPVSGTYVLAGGYLRNDSRALPWIPTAYVWSFNPAASASPRSTHTWGKTATMERRRSSALAIPYDDGKIYIFAGDLDLPPSLEIYDPRSGSVSPPLVFPEDLFPHCNFAPCSYFLWKGSSKPQKEHPLIMLHFFDKTTRKHRLLSFNVQESLLEVFDPNFPRLNLLEPWTTVLVPLDGIDTLLITVRPDRWLVYDMSSRRKTGVVRVLDFKPDREVMHAFSRQCLDGSHMVYIFMDGYQHDYLTTQFSVPYAVFKVRKVEGKFTAALESRGALGNDECSHFFIFPTHPKEAPDLLPKEAPDLPLLGHECRLGKWRRWLMCAGGGGVVTSLLFLFYLCRQTMDASGSGFRRKKGQN